MTISAVDRMREWANGGKLYKDTQHFVLHHADEIEREVAERFMELPCDKDGVPIHMGDTLEFNGNGGIVRAINERMVVAMHVDHDYLNYAKYGLLWDSKDCCHVKPRTLEDVLRDYACDFADSSGPDYDEEVTKRYAKEIRELMEVGDD